MAVFDSKHLWISSCLMFLFCYGVTNSPTTTSTVTIYDEETTTGYDLSTESDMAIGPTTCLQRFQGRGFQEMACACFNLCDYGAVKLAHANNERKSQMKGVIAKGFFYCLMFLLGVFGNVVVIVSITRYMGRPSITNIYVCNLAAADLLVTVFCVPFKLIENVLFYWPTTVGLCKIMLWLYFVCFMCSVFTLTCISVERYLAICHPMRKWLMASKKRTAVTIALIWPLSGILAAVIPYYGMIHGSSCTVSNDGAILAPIYLYLTVLILCIPWIIMTFCYIRISQELWQSIKAKLGMHKSGNDDGQYSSKNESNDDDKTTAGRIQVIRMMVLVLVVFLVCWIPYLLVQCILMVNEWTSSTYVSYRTLLISMSSYFNLLSLANSCLNPILYGVLSRTFRMAFIRCLTCGRRGNEVIRSTYATNTNNYSLSTARGGRTEMSSVATRQSNASTGPL